MSLTGADTEYGGQDQDQDFENWVSRRLETKTQVSRTTTLLLVHVNGFPYESQSRDSLHQVNKPVTAIKKASYIKTKRPLVEVINDY